MNSSGSSISDTTQANICTNTDSPYSFTSLQDAINGAGEWFCTVKCKGYSITQPMVLNEHNICQFLVPGGTQESTSDIDLTKNGNYSDVSRWRGSTFKFDTNAFRGTDHRHQIKNYILEACARSGFKAEAEVKLVHPLPTHPNPSKSATIHFRCCYNKVPISELPPKSGGM